jgi:hypothetical protein
MPGRAEASGPGCRAGPGGFHTLTGPMPVNYWTLKPRLYAPVPELATTT